MADSYGNMSPQEWQQFMLALSPNAIYGDQDRAIQEQLAQAYALRNRQQSPHTTGMGAALGGIGDILQVQAGQHQMKDLQARQQMMQQSYLKAIQDAIRAQGSSQTPQAGLARGYMPMPGPEEGP